MKNEETIRSVAENVSDIVEDCCGVTLGGSRAFGMDDGASDVEMYFYSHNGAPELSALDKRLCQLGAKHRRSGEFLWNKKPWGPHSFFVLNDLYFEIGYRKIEETQEKIERYLNGDVMPHTDFHDLGSGYLLGSFTASVCAEKEMLLCGDEIFKLKQLAEQFPDKLLDALKQEYLYTAKGFIQGKLKAAAERRDLFFYDVISARVVRCLMIMGFAAGRKHFPGDKWNEPLLLRSGWENAAAFTELLRQHSLLKGESFELLEAKRQLLSDALSLMTHFGEI